MTDAAVQPRLADSASQPDAATRAEVQEVVRGFAKALRTHLLYEGTSPALDRFVDALRERLAALWSRIPYLNVQVEDGELLWNEVAVYQSEERENLAFLLYKDG